MKDVVACDKPRGVCKLTLIRGFPNGGTRPASAVIFKHVVFNDWLISLMLKTLGETSWQKGSYIKTKRRKSLNRTKK